MQYLEEITIQSLIYLLFSSESKFDLSSIWYEERINIFVTIHDNSLGDCFFFTLNEEKAKQVLNDKDFVQNINNASDKDDTMLALYKNVVRLKEKSLNFEEVIKTDNNLSYEIFFVSHMYILNIINSKKEKILSYLRKYIENFRLNSLISETNYCDFERSMNRAYEIFDILYIKLGSRFNTNKNMEIGSKKIQIEKELRFFEIILYLYFKGYININDCNFRKDNNELNLNVNVNFNRKPSEIFDIQDNWYYYGDLKVNERDRIALYKNNNYHFRLTSGGAFKLLCLIIQKPNKEITFKEACSFIDSNFDIKKYDKIPKLYKSSIKGYVKEIKKNLRINEDSDKSVDIIVRDNCIKLIPIPTKNK